MANYSSTQPTKPANIPGLKKAMNVNTGEPSQVKNNIDQVLQPTGDGGVAGGKIPPVGATGNEPAEQPPTEAAKRYNEDIRLGEQANARVDMTPQPNPETEAKRKTKGKTVQMKLLRGYVPVGEYTIVGTPPEPALAGTGFANKLLAGTSLIVSAEEGREMLKKGIAERGDDF